MLEELRNLTSPMIPVPLLKNMKYVIDRTILSTISLSDLFSTHLHNMAAYQFSCIVHYDWVPTTSFLFIHHVPPIGNRSSYSSWQFLRPCRQNQWEEHIPIQVVATRQKESTKWMESVRGIFSWDFENKVGNSKIIWSVKTSIFEE